MIRRPPRSPLFPSTTLFRSRVEAAVRRGVEPPFGRIVVRPPDDRLAAPRAHLGEAREMHDLEEPPLIVGGVPADARELMQRREIDQILHALLGHEVSRRVRMNAPQREPPS